VPYIATRAEAQIGGAIALEMLADLHHDYDAAIIAAFGDPGLFGARELFDLPVVGMAEASMLTACMLGRRFIIVTFARALGPWYQECVDMHGLTGRCAGIRALDDPFESIGDVQDEKESLLAQLAKQATLELEADAVILAGAPLAGLAAHQGPRTRSGCRSDGGGREAGRGPGYARRPEAHRRNLPAARREGGHRFARVACGAHRAS
jgi:Asp/Glu/hydantoin racemase